MWRPTLSPEQALRQAGDTASQYMAQAINIYNKQCPECFTVDPYDCDNEPNTIKPEVIRAWGNIISALISAQAQDFNTTARLVQEYDRTDQMSFIDSVANHK